MNADPCGLMTVSASSCPARILRLIVATDTPRMPAASATLTRWNVSP